MPFSGAAGWSEERGVDSVLGRWLKSNMVRPCFCADEHLAGQEAHTVPFPTDLDPALQAALRQRGISALYTHQARAFELARSHSNVAGVPGGAREQPRAVVISTPTASGKSLCFHLPMLSKLREDPDARAIYLFPTKALARDQEASLQQLMTHAGLGTPAIVYDGDTPGDARRAARERGRVLLTNPDMIHTGILPHHANFARTFQNLRYVVVDEMHMYKGVFGSHVANVLRRLMRVAAFHGSQPILIGATATIGNPREHAARLFGLPVDDVALVSESGAPRGDRRFFLFNPPVVNAELGIRASYVKQAVMLAADLVRAKVPTLIFGHSRNNVEIMLRYLRERVGKDVDPSRIMGYRGGYLPETRREIERALRAGELLAIVATNALELGIDVGELDAVICAGYPGSVAATWQRFGRAGRRGGLSIAVLITSSAPVDQYLAREPGYLLGAPVEEARIDPDNVEILIQHLKCGAFELPFTRGERFGGLTSEETVDALEFLAKRKVLHEARGTFHWAADAYPANNVSLRSVGWDNVVIVDVARDKAIAELDWRGSHTMLHEQAIYQHDGECWQVEKLDYENHKAFVRKVEPDYWTDAMTYTNIAILEESALGPATTTASGGDWPSGWGEVSVVEKVVGYKKIKFYTHENTGYGEVFLPEMQMHTAAFWFTVPERVCAEIDAGRAAAVDALRGIGIALETVATLALMCDPRDLGTSLGDTHEVEDAEGNTISLPRKTPGGARLTAPGVQRGGPAAGYNPTLFLYEHVPGGTGLSQRIFEQRETLLARALRLIERCPCTDGCPACVGPGAGTAPQAGPGGGDTRKGVALELLRRVVATA